MAGWQILNVRLATRMKPGDLQIWMASWLILNTGLATPMKPGELRITMKPCHSRLSSMVRWIMGSREEECFDATSALPGGSLLACSNRGSRATELIRNCCQHKLMTALILSRNGQHLTQLQAHANVQPRKPGDSSHHANR